MNIRFFLFNEYPQIGDDRFANSLKYMFSEYLADDESVGIYPSVKAAVNNISTALKDSHIIVFFAAIDSYAEIKRKLAKTFNIEMQINEELQGKAFATLNKILTNSSSEEFAHCYAPVNSRIFALEDGLYSGFAAVSGNQTVICLPWETGRTELILTKQVIPYINSAYDISISENVLRDYNCYTLADNIKLNNFDLAIAKTNTSSYFLEYVGNNTVIKDAIKDTSRSEKRGNLAPEKHIINLSIMAKELASTKYGIAISNAYYTGTDAESEKVIYLAVTNDKNTSVREIHSFIGEDVDYFLERASGDLCSLICEVVESDGNSPEEVDVKVTDGTKKYKIGIAVVSVLIVALISGIIFIFASNNTTPKSLIDRTKEVVASSDDENETEVTANETEVTANENTSEDEDKSVEENENDETDLTETTEGTTNTAV